MHQVLSNQLANCQTTTKKMSFNKDLLQSKHLSIEWMVVIAFVLVTLFQNLICKLIMRFNLNNQFNSPVIKRRLKLLLFYLTLLYTLTRINYMTMASELINLIRSFTTFLLIFPIMCVFSNIFIKFVF